MQGWSLSMSNKTLIVITSVLFLGCSGTADDQTTAARDTTQPVQHSNHAINTPSVNSEQVPQTSPNRLICSPGCRISIEDENSPIPRWCKAWTAEAPQCRELPDGSLMCIGALSGVHNAGRQFFATRADALSALNETQRAPGKGDKQSIVCTDIDLEILSKEGLDERGLKKCRPGCDLGTDTTAFLPIVESPPNMPEWCAVVSDGCNTRYDDNSRTDMNCFPEKTYPTDRCLTLKTILDDH